MSTSDSIAIKDDSGSEIDAHFLLEAIGGKTTLVIDSKGGGANSPSRRNQQYNLGFRLLLERLALKGATIDDAAVDSLETQRANLSLSQRRLRMTEPYSFPIRLSRVADFVKLRKALSAAQKPIGQKPGTQGGNGQKRTRLYISLNEEHADLSNLKRALANPTQPIIISDKDVSHAATAADANRDFDPSTAEDARKRILAAIVQRQGQPAFRKKLLKAYDGKCAITGCNSTEVLEAAHIIPYNGGTTNTPQNGLLLRSDVHTLFDRGLIAIDTTNWKVLLHKSLKATDYATSLKERTLRRPADELLHPSIAALNRHKANSGI